MAHNDDSNIKNMIVEDDIHNLPAHLNVAVPNEESKVEIFSSNPSSNLGKSQSQSTLDSDRNTSLSSLSSASKWDLIDQTLEYIPCLYMPYDDGATKLVIYFHGNAEDIGLAFDLLY